MKKLTLSICVFALSSFSSIPGLGQSQATSVNRAQPPSVGGANPRPLSVGGANPRPKNASLDLSSLIILMLQVL